MVFVVSFLAAVHQGLVVVGASQGPVEVHRVHRVYREASRSLETNLWFPEEGAWIS
jgi:hypothetical protein